MTASRRPSRALEPSPTLKRLFQARNEWDRLHQLTNLLKEAHLDVPEFFENPEIWSAICREQDCEKLAWRLGHAIRSRSGGRVPQSLEPYLDRPEYEREQNERLRQDFHHELSSWLQAEPVLPRKQAKRALRVVWAVKPTSDPLQSQVQIDLRANSAKLREGSRNFFQVRGLCNELGHRPELFNHEDANLLRWLNDHLSLLLTDKHKYGSPFLNDNHSLLVWLQRWGQSGRCQIEGSNEVMEYSPLPARIVPALNTEANRNGNGNGHAAGAISLAFEVARHDGPNVPLEKAVLFLAPKSSQAKLDLEFVCLGNRFYRLTERPPRRVLELAHHQAQSRLETGQARQLLPVLLRRFPALQSKVRMHLRQIPAQVRFYFSLDADDTLHVRLKAVAEKPKLAWEWNENGWRRLPAEKDPAADANGDSDDAIVVIPSPPEEVTGHQNGDALLGVPPPEPQGEVWDEVPAEADVAPAVEWLAGWQGEPGELVGRPDEPGWWLMIEGKELPRLVQHWRERSADWQYFGNKRFQQLWQQKKRRVPRLRIQSSGMDWFSIRAEWEAESERITAADWQKLQRSQDPFIKLQSGDWVSREEMEQAEATLGAMAEVGLDPSSPERQVSKLELAAGQDKAWARLAGLGDEDLEATLERLRQELADFDGIPEVPLPAGLKATLRPYQKEGLDFLSYTAQLRMGAILADDMGLGKTVQALAWLLRMREQDGQAPTLVVCPASVMFNWEREAGQFAPELKVLSLFAGERRHELREEIPRHDLIITNYALLRRDLPALKKFNFRAVILDEAQNVKNPDSMVAKAARQLESGHRLALTGTPLENRLLDLWSIVEFIHPGYLPPRTTFLDMYDRGAPPHRRALLSSRLRPLVLRRLKKDVARDLPDRIEERIDCELTPAQRRLYLAELQRSRQALNGMDPAHGPGRIHALAALTRLRQICCHPALVKAKKNIGCGKINAFFETLENLQAEGHKVLVFSQFVEMLKLLRGQIEERGWPLYMLTGQTTKRAEVVEQFQSDPRAAIFLLSLKAAGTGLNLTSASYVVLYDPWWNPAVEAQAIDRTHRIGQDRTVIAYRLVTRDTVEEKIWQLQQQKAQLVADIFGEGEFSGSLTKDDLNYLLADDATEIDAEE
ncbi:MAG: DEAD/DEAH box helicase [Verrucomicrobiota bacterium]